MDGHKPIGGAEAGTEQSNLVFLCPDDVPQSPEEPSRARPKRSEKASKRRRILTASLTALLVVSALGLFVFRDGLTGERFRQLLGRDGAETPAREAFTYETGAEQVFAPAGDGLAVAGTSSVQLLDARGQTVFRQAVSFDLPAVFACAERALFCDLGGTECIVAGTGGESVTLSGGKDRETLTASMNENGWFALVTAEPGYKGLVSVYNAACEKQYEWWSGAGHVLRAAVGPDNQTLAVLTVEKDGTVLHFLALNSETPLSETLLEGRVLYDLGYLDASTVRIIGDDGLVIAEKDGSVRGEYPLDGQFLLDYDFGSTEFTALFVSDYRGGAGGTLLTLDASGGVIGARELAQDTVSLSAEGKRLLVMTGGGLTMYDSGLTQRGADGTLMTARRAVLRPAGDILLLSAYSAERFSFSGKGGNG